MVCIPSEVLLEKTNRAFSSGYQLEMASGLGLWALCPLLLALGPHVVQVRIGSVHAATISVSSYE